MSTDAVRAALAELVALKDLKDRLDLAETNIGKMLGQMPFDSMEDWREASREYMRRKPLAWAAARAALSEPAPGDVAQWLASVAADGYRTDEERFAARILLRIATTQQEPDKQLCTFYGVDTFPALVEAMEHHIKKLQAKLPQNDMPAATKTRFA